MLAIILFYPKIINKKVDYGLKIQYFQFKLQIKHLFNMYQNNFEFILKITSFMPKS